MSAKRGSSVKKSDSSTTGRGKPKVEWQGYVNVELNKQDKDEITKIKNPAEYVDTVVTDLVANGYSMKVRYDDYNQCFAASFYCENSADPNAGWCLSMRGNDWFTALFRLCFVHGTLLSGTWNTSVGTGWKDDQW